MLEVLHKKKHVNKPAFGTWGEGAETMLKKGGGKSMKKAPANRKISILNIWRGRAWDT